MHSIAVRKSRKRSGFVIYSYLEDIAFSVVKKDETRYAKGVVRTICQLKSIRSGTFSVMKMVYKLE